MGANDELSNSERKEALLINTVSQCDLIAFCALCPDPDEVTAYLATLGFSLTFSASPKWYGKIGMHLPAQYHYRDASGTELIYLAGKDSPGGSGMRYPHHESRWWLTAGSSHYDFNLVMQELSRAYSIDWQEEV